MKCLKPLLHGRVLAARIDILPFFFLKSRRSLTRRTIHVRFSLRDIARHAPEKSNRISHSHGRDFNAMLAYDCNSQKSLKPHLHGRLLAARIDILPFFFLKSRRSLTRRTIHVRFSLRDIARHAPEKSNRISHSHGRDFNAMLAYDCNSQKSLKPHLHGRLLAARIDILPFFFLKSRRSLTRRKIHV